MMVKHDLLEIKKYLQDDKEISAYIRGLLDELFLYKMLLTYYMGAAALHTAPEIFATIRVSFEGVFVEWILTGKKMEDIWKKRHDRYKSILKKVGALPEDIEVSWIRHVKFVEKTKGAILRTLV